MLENLTVRAGQGFAGAIVAVVLAALIPFSAAARQGSPEQVVESYYATLLGVMRDAKNLGYDGRYKTLEPAVRDTFDLGFIARQSVGRFWKKLDESKKKRLVDEFSRLSIATYAARFDDYAGEKFVVLGTIETRRKDKLVKTQIVSSKGKKTAINYLLRKRDAEWRVIDIYLKGTISEVATRRAEFSAVIRRSGYEALIEAIGAKIETLQSD